MCVCVCGGERRERKQYSLTWGVTHVDKIREVQNNNSKKNKKNTDVNTGKLSTSNYQLALFM